MSENKKILSRATKAAYKKRSLAKPKDMIYKPMDDSYNFTSLSVKPSKIHGKGLFANEFIKAGDNIMLSHKKFSYEDDGVEYEESVNTSPYSKMYNHNETNPNAVNHFDSSGKNLYLIASRDIQPGEEITTNYYALNEPTLENPNDFGTEYESTSDIAKAMMEQEKMYDQDYMAKGGSLNRIVLRDLNRQLRDPYKSKKYSKSLSATNSLFAPNYLFSKPSPRRIYNPNAKYFRDGGLVVKQRRGVRENPDGTVSTHLMRAEYIPERGWVAFPSLFQDSKPYADDSQNWVDMSEEKDWMKIYEEAERRGEVYDFGEDKKAALAFGEGSWKADGGEILPQAQVGRFVKSTKKLPKPKPSKQVKGVGVKSSNLKVDGSPSSIRSKADLDEIAGQVKIPKKTISKKDLKNVSGFKGINTLDRGKLLSRAELDVLEKTAADYKNYGLRLPNIVSAIKESQGRLLKNQLSPGQYELPLRGVDLTTDNRIEITADDVGRGTRDKRFGILGEPDEQKLALMQDMILQSSDVFKTNIEKYLENPYVIETKRGDSLVFDDDGFLTKPLGSFYHGVGRTSPGFTLETLEFDRSKLDPKGFKDWTSTGTKPGNSLSEYGFFGALNKNQGAQASLKYDGPTEYAINKLLRDPSSRPADLGRMKEIGVSPNARLVGGDSPYVLNALRDVGVHFLELSTGPHIGGHMGMTPQKAATLRSKYGIDGIIDISGNELVILNPDVITSVSDVPFKLFDYTNPLIVGLQQNRNTQTNIGNLLREQFGAQFIDPNRLQPYLPDGRTSKDWVVGGKDKLGSMFDSDNLRNARRVLSFDGINRNLGIREYFVDLPFSIPFGEKWWKAAEPNLDLIRKKGGVTPKAQVGRFLPKSLTPRASRPKESQNIQIKPGYVKGEYYPSYFNKRAPKKSNYEIMKQAYGADSVPNLALKVLGDKYNKTLSGLIKGTKELIKGYKGTKGRSFSEVFPITKSQKQRSDIIQNEAHRSGVDFLTKYLYGRLNPNFQEEGQTLNPTIQDKILNIYKNADPKDRPMRWQVEDRIQRSEKGNPLFGDNEGNISYTLSGKDPYPSSDNTNIRDNENPIGKFKNVLTSGIRSTLSMPGLNDAQKTRIINSNLRGVLGANEPRQQTSTTFKGRGPYRYSPQEITDTAIHEGAHTAEELGFEGKPIGKVYATYDHDKGYYYPNPDTKIGQFFAKVMPDADWFGSPGELFAEKMTGIKKLYEDTKTKLSDDYVLVDGVEMPHRDYYIQELGGVEAYDDWLMDSMRNPTDAQLDYMMDIQDLHNFFKPGTSKADKYKALRYLPGLVTPFLLPSLTDQE